MNGPKRPWCNMATKTLQDQQLNACNAMYMWPLNKALNSSAPTLMQYLDIKNSMKLVIPLHFISVLILAGSAFYQI